MKGKRKKMALAAVVVLVTALGLCFVLNFFLQVAKDAVERVSENLAVEEVFEGAVFEQEFATRLDNLHDMEVFIAGDPIQNEEGGEEFQDATISLDTLLEEGEGALIAFRKPDPANKSEGSSSSASSSAEPDPGVPTYTYIYDVASPAAIVDRYLDAVLGGEEKFVLVDETFLHLEERPVLEDAVGSVTIARASVQEGHVFQMVIGWSDASALTFRTSAPEGKIHEPEKNPGGGLGSEVIETVPVTAQIEKIKGMSPSQLGLDGESMEEYEIFPVEGFVKVDGLDCRRFNLYRRMESGGGHYPDLEGIIMLSADQEHIYWLDPESNAVTELR